MRNLRYAYAKEIQRHVDITLRGLYNWRKEKEELVSLHNQVIEDLRKTITKWVEEQHSDIEEEKRE